MILYDIRSDQIHYTREFLMVICRIHISLELSMSTLHLFRIRTSCLRHASVSWHRAVWVKCGLVSAKTLPISLKPCGSVSVRFVLEEFQDTSSIGGTGVTYTALYYLFRDHISNFGTIFQDISRHFTISQVSIFHDIYILWHPIIRYLYYFILFIRYIV